ncbi:MULTISPECIES: class I lanthipeptide [unclassified Flavobacterium]
MKTQKVNNKLTFTKVDVLELNEDQMSEVNGGVFTSRYCIIILEDMF